MRSEVLAYARENDLFSPGDRVICAVSGGADSIAMLWCLRSLEEKLSITVSAAHFNHHLRGEESDRDEAFVRAFCEGFGIPCFFGSGTVSPASRGLEAAARDARYAFLLSLDPAAKIATAHTADDNAETLLMHLLRGASLAGLGGIPPKRGRIVRPLLSVTRAQILAYLQELGLAHVEDSTNAQDEFLRNRLRHGILPALRQENPSFSKNVTAMTARLRQDEDFLSAAARAALERARVENGLSCAVLRGLHPALLGRALGMYLQESGVPEPESGHIAGAKALVLSANPSAAAAFPGGLRLRRVYDLLTAERPQAGDFVPVPLAVPGVTELPQLGFAITCREELAQPGAKSTPNEFLIDFASLSGPLTVRPRRPGDRITRPGGAKSLKSLFIDRKIPAAQRDRIPVLADEKGIVGVYSIGPDQSRVSIAGAPALRISINRTK